MSQYLSLFHQPKSPKFKLALNHKIRVPENPATQFVASQIFPIARTSPFASLGKVTHVVLFYARSVRTLTLELVSTHAPIENRVFFTHGLASIVVFCTSLIEKQEVIERCGHLCSAIEVWPLDGNDVFDLADIEQTRRPIIDTTSDLSPIDDQLLPPEIQTQVRQFNANIVFAKRQAQLYVPEILPLLDGLLEVLRQAADDVRADDSISKGTSLMGHAARHHYTSEFVEVNSSLTMLISQLFSSCMPCVNSRYPVVEYSLFGIGGCYRAIWRVYKHIADVFEDEKIVESVLASFPGERGFRIFKRRPAFSPDAWTEHPAQIEKMEPPPREYETRYLIPYFSSRWGFHETRHTLSVSWQCIHSCSSKEWNLLTLSHEFLHSHLNTILMILLPGNDEQTEELCRKYSEYKYSQDDDTNLQESFQMALISQFLAMETIDRAALNSGEARAPGTISLKHLRVLVDEHWGYVNEIMVHVLDFLYFYGGDERKYIRSLWFSWSLVPKVLRNLPHYLQRTICALASGTPSSVNPNEAFDYAVKTLQDVLADVSQDEHTALIAAAIDALNDKRTVRHLRLKFSVNWYLVSVTKRFLYSKRMHGCLVKDKTSSTNPTTAERYYDVEPCSFDTDMIESPVGFLLSRFDQRKGTGISESARSLWQLLILVEGVEDG